MPAGSTAATASGRATSCRRRAATRASRRLQPTPARPAPNERAEACQRGTFGCPAPGLPSSGELWPVPIRLVRQPQLARSPDAGPALGVVARRVNGRCQQATDGYRPVPAAPRRPAHRLGNLDAPRIRALAAAGPGQRQEEAGRRFPTRSACRRGRTTARRRRLRVPSRRRKRVDHPPPCPAPPRLGSGQRARWGGRLPPAERPVRAILPARGSRLPPLQRGGRQDLSRVAPTVACRDHGAACPGARPRPR